MDGSVPNESHDRMGLRTIQIAMAARSYEIKSNTGYIPGWNALTLLRRGQRVVRDEKHNICIPWMPPLPRGSLLQYNGRRFSIHADYASSRWDSAHVAASRASAATVTCTHVAPPHNWVPRHIILPTQICCRVFRTDSGVPSLTGAGPACSDVNQVARACAIIFMLLPIRGNVHRECILRHGETHVRRDVYGPDTVSFSTMSSLSCVLWCRRLPKRTRCHAENVLLLFRNTHIMKLFGRHTIRN